MSNSQRVAFTPQAKASGFSATRLMKINYLLPTILMLLMASGIANAMTVSLTANRTSAELGQSLTLTMSARGGVAPYFFTIYGDTGAQLADIEIINGNNVAVGYNDFNFQPIYQMVYGMNYITNPNIAGNINYRISVTDNTLVNVTNASVALSINSTPQVTLSPKYATIPPYSNITFSNHTTGGSPPYTYHYNITGWNYNIINNTITFNRIESYSVKLIAKDSLGFTGSAISIIEAAYLPSVITVGNCVIVDNMSQNGVQSIIPISGQKIPALVNYITPTYAGLTVNGQQATLNFTNNSYAAINGFYIEYVNFSWAPILHTVSIEVCPGSSPITSTTTSISTTSTSSSTSTASTTTATTTASSSSTTTVTATAPPAQKSSSNPTWAIAAIVIIIISTAIIWKLLG